MAGNGAGISGRTHITESNIACAFRARSLGFPDLARRVEMGMRRIGRTQSAEPRDEITSGSYSASTATWNGMSACPGIARSASITGLPVAIKVGTKWGPIRRITIDCLPGILDVGRGSPTWGIFYEHTQFPGRYHNAYIVCDYRWKRESNDQYATTGRLVAFFLKRKGASWDASMETLARPKPGARDRAGKLINFALVDV